MQVDSSPELGISPPAHGGNSLERDPWLTQGFESREGQDRKGIKKTPSSPWLPMGFFSVNLGRYPILLSFTFVCDVRARTGSSLSGSGFSESRKHLDSGT